MTQSVIARAVTNTDKLAFAEGALKTERACFSSDYEVLVFLARRIVVLEAIVADYRRRIQKA